MAKYHDGVPRQIDRFDRFDCFGGVGGRVATVCRAANPEQLAHACHI
ncbi:hypothetical protein [Streptomyces sp. NPDC047071]